MSQGNRKAKFYVSMGQIARLMKLPHGVTPVFMYASSDPPGAYVVVESEAFPEQPNDCELPVIWHSLAVTACEVDGEVFTRVECTETAQEIGERLPKLMMFS